MAEAVCSTMPLINLMDVTLALKMDKGDCVMLESYTVEDFPSVGFNYGSKLTRIRVIYQEATSDDEKTVSYVVKMYSSPKGSAAELLNRFFTAEINFYKDILPKLNYTLEKYDEPHLRVPKFFHSILADNHALIYLEDLKDRFRMHDRREPLDEPHIILILNELARLHSASNLFFSKEYITRVALSHKYPVLKGRLDDSGPFKTKTMRNSLLNFADICKSIENYEYVVKYLKERHMERDELGYYKFSMEWRKMVRTSDEFYSIRHGDFWDNNFMFQYSPEGVPVECVLLDFQLVGVGSIALDLHNFLYPCVEAKFREENLDRLLSIYYNTCKSIGDKANNELPYNLPKLKEEFEGKRMFGFVMAISLVPFSMLEPKDSPNIIKLLTDTIRKGEVLDKYKIKCTEALKSSPFLRSRLLDSFDHLSDIGFFNN